MTALKPARGWAIVTNDGFVANTYHTYKEVSRKSRPDIWWIRNDSRLVEVEIRSVEPCRWRKDEDGIWHGECGIVWYFDDDGSVADHNVVYCPQCGQPVEVAPHAEL